jgi:hypothetical protein
MSLPDLIWVNKVSYMLDVGREFSLLLPLVVGYLRWDYLQPHHKAVFWCCVMWAVLTATGEVLFFLKQPNIAVWNSVTILETLFIFHSFYLVIRSEKLRRYLRMSVALFIVVAIADFFFLSGLKATTVYTVALESVLLVVVVLLYFEQLMQELRTTPLERNPMFVIGIGVMTYFAGTVMVFLLQDTVTGVQDTLMMMINSILSLVLNSIIARAFWLVGRAQPSAKPSIGPVAVRRVIRR